MRELKHIGRVKATNKKCLVAYRTLPGDAYNCLIVPTENLPDSYHDSLINLVESNTGQTANEFADALARTNFSDGSIMLSALHAQGRLVKVGTDQIEMTPQPAVSILLAELNQIIAEQRGIAVDELSVKPKDVVEAKPIQAIKQDDAIKTRLAASVNQESIESGESITVCPAEQAIKLRADVARMELEIIKMRVLADSLLPISVAQKHTPVAKKATPSRVVKKAKV